MFSIAHLIGEPLHLDEATAKLKRHSVARLQVELDVLRDCPLKIWIQIGTKEGFWQIVDYEQVPPYYCHCWHLGHQESQCHVQHPDLRLTNNIAKVSATIPKSQIQYLPVYGPKMQQSPLSHPDPLLSQNSSLTNTQKAAVLIDVISSQKAVEQKTPTPVVPRHSDHHCPNLLLTMVPTFLSFRINSQYRLTII